MPEENLVELNTILEEYTDVLANPDNLDLSKRLEEIRQMLITLNELENTALNSQNINDSFAAQEFLEKFKAEIKQLTEDLAKAKRLNWGQFERQLYAKYTQTEIEELQKLIKLWSPGTYFSVAESIIDHTYRKGYNDNFLEYLQDAAKFDKNQAVRIPPLGYRDDDTVRWEIKQTGEYLIEDNLGKIRTYGVN